ncbi:PASTA domain-containing protein [Lysobacter niastensis]|nr:PASTA domain-containing protein [Lysobacter niastensis]
MRRSAFVRAGLGLLAGLAIWSASTGAWACVEHKTHVRGKGTQILVPGLMGDSERLAIECLRRYGYTPKLGGLIPSSRPEGTVALTVPAEGAAPIPEGKGTHAPVAVTYWVSSGGVAHNGAAAAQAPSDEAAPRQDQPASTRTVTVPDLNGRSLSSAKSRLRWNRLGFGEVAWQARGGKAGRVIAQEPGAGTRVPIRTSVDLVVSNGQQPELVPDVVGHQEMRAIGELASANLNATRQGRMHSARRAGTVLRTDPSAGSEAPSGGVAYWVASGQNVVPDLRGRTRDGAAQALRASGFAMGKAPVRFDDGKPNRVVEQKPAAGMVVNVDTPVSVWLSKPRMVPKVAGMLERDAKKALAAAGLKGVRVGEGPVSPEGGRVSSSEPRAGTRVSKNTTVRYRLAPQVVAAVSTDAANDGQDKHASQPSGQDDGARNMALETARYSESTLVASNDTAPIRDNSTTVRDDTTPTSTGTTVRQDAANLPQDAFSLAQRTWKVLAGSTSLALFLAGVWWTQLRTWPWRWPPPRPRMDVRIKPARPPWPMMSPLDHDPALDVRIRSTFAQGETTFEQPLPVLGTEIRHD